jgi:hypothetical protein
LERPLALDYQAVRIKVAVVHQQISIGFTVALAVTMAHRLGLKQMGHFEGVIS